MPYELLTFLKILKTPRVHDEIDVHLQGSFLHYILEAGDYIPAYVVFLVKYLTPLYTEYRLILRVCVHVLSNLSDNIVGIVLRVTEGVNIDIKYKICPNY